MQMLPPPPQDDDIDEIEQEYNKNSFGFYAKVGILGYVARSSCSYSPSSYYSYCSTDYYYNFVPGISAYYAWRASNGMGVEITLEYEYNASDGLAGSTTSVTRNFITPAIYFSEQTHGLLWRIGVGYDIGLPYNETSSYMGVTYKTSANYHGIAILASSEWILNKNNAIGLFVKGSFRWLNSNTIIGNSSYPESDFNHIVYVLGLNYRFNMGF